ncbi:hypothetical protein OT109_08825 [Phycisphaeraceae bacterium D3-23]
MPTDPQQQLEALRRTLCGDCGVGPFKGVRHHRRGPLRVSRWLVLGLVLVGAAGIGLVLWLGLG